MKTHNLQGVPTPYSPHPYIGVFLEQTLCFINNKAKSQLDNGLTRWARESKSRQQEGDAPKPHHNMCKCIIVISFANVRKLGHLKPQGQLLTNLVTCKRLGRGRRDLYVINVAPNTQQYMAAEVTNLSLFCYLW